MVEISYKQNVSFPQARSLQASYASIARGTQPILGTDNSITTPLSTQQQIPTQQQPQHTATQHNPQQTLTQHPHLTCETGTDTPPSDIQQEIVQADINHTEKIIIANKPSKALYVPVETYIAMQNINNAITKVASLPLSHPFKTDVENLIKNFLEQLGKILGSIPTNP